MLALWLTVDLSRVPPTSRPMAGGMRFSPAKTWDRSIMISYSTSFAFVAVTHLSLSDRHCSTNKTACVKVMNKSHGSYKRCTCIFIRQVKPCDFLFHFFKLTSSLGCLPHALTASTVDGPVIVWPPALYLCDKHTHTAECQLTCFHSPCRPHLFEVHALLLLGCVFPRLQLIGSSLSLRDLSLSLRVWRWIGLFMLASDRVAVVATLWTIVIALASLMSLKSRTSNGTDKLFATLCIKDPGF